jgi:hypothetical protein
MKLIHDNTLGFLTSIISGFQNDNFEDGELMLPYKTDIFMQVKLNELQNLVDNNPTYKLFTIKSTINSSTLALLKLSADALIDCANAVSVTSMSSSSGYSHYMDDVNEIKAFSKEIKQKYSNGENLGLEDRKKLLEYDGVPSTLEAKLVFENGTSELNRFLTDYLNEYSQKNLLGQERLYMPQVYSNLILSTINKPEFVNIYGSKRILVSGFSSNMFCHSLKWIESLGIIETLSIKEAVSSTHMNYNQMKWEAVINNLGFPKAIEDKQEPINTESIICQTNGLSVLKMPPNRAFIRFNGFKDSKPFSSNVPWAKIFIDFVKNIRLEKKSMEALWNVSKKNGWKRKTGSSSSKASTIKSEVVKALKRNCPDFYTHINIKKGTGVCKNSYLLEIRS